MRNTTTSPHFICARWSTTCAETGRTIRRGAQCLYYPGSRKCYHPESNQAQAWADCEMDRTVFGYEY